MDFVCEVSANRKADYLNLLFWAQFDFTPLGVEQTAPGSFIKKLRESWVSAWPQSTGRKVTAGPFQLDYHNRDVVETSCPDGTGSQEFRIGSPYGSLRPDLGNLVGPGGVCHF